MQLTRPFKGNKAMWAFSLLLYRGIKVPFSRPTSDWVCTICVGLTGARHVALFAAPPTHHPSQPQHQPQQHEISSCHLVPPFGSEKITFQSLAEKMRYAWWSTEPNSQHAPCTPIKAGRTGTPGPMNHVHKETFVNKRYKHSAFIPTHSKK